MAGLITDDTTISVNVAGIQFERSTFVERVREILADTDLPGHNLRLEITESLIIDRTDTTVQKLFALKELGVHLGIDDFGTGYSSLSRLHSFPIDTLKIDRSFVNRLGVDTGEEVVKTIISLGLTLKLNVVAEGIETREQLRQLQNLGCHYGQGYLFSPPLSADAIENYLRKNLDIARSQHCS